jgi:hypothetical protein
MNETLTKDELKAILDTQSKATEQMVLVAKALTDILTEQKRITDKLSNGFIKDLSDKCKENGTICSTGITRSFEKALEPLVNDLPEIKEAVLTTRDDAKFSKWFIGSVGLVMVVAMVLLRGLDSRIMWNKTDKQTTIDTAKIIEAIHEAEAINHKQ